MSYSSAEIKRRKERALNEFVHEWFNKDGNPVLLGPENTEKSLQKLVRKFGFALIKFEDHKQNDADAVKAINRAIRQLKRLGKRVTLTSIQKITRIKLENMRKLMVVHGLYDPKTKKVVDYYNEFKLGDMPSWE